MAILRSPSPSPSWLPWLLLAPALVPVLFQMGRGLGNSGFALIWLALLAATLKYRAWSLPRRLRPAALIWLALLASGGLGAAWSIAPAAAGEYWLRYALAGSVFFMIAMLIRRFGFSDYDGLMQRIGWIGLASFGWLLGHALLTWNTPGFQPEFHIRGLVPAYLAPFGLYLMARGLPFRLRIVAMPIYGALLAWLLVRANSLTEVLAFAAALFVLALLSIRTWPVRLGFAAALAAGFAALILIFDPAGEVLTSDTPHVSQTENSDWTALADKLTSHRTLIWRQALETPPPDPWLGVGAGNVAHYAPVRMEGIGAVKHLHSLFLDLWYEIGLIGLGLFAAFTAAQFVPAWRRRAAAASPTLLASMAAIAMAGLIEQHYRSYHFALFLPYLFTLLDQRACGERDGAPA